MTLTFTIPGRPRPKKNSPRIARTPSGRPFVLPSAANVAWTKAAVTALRAQYRGPHGPLPPLEGPVAVTYHFHFATRQWEADADNLMASVNDALAKAGILANDRQIRCGVFAKHFGAEEPRTEIVIHAAPEEMTP